MTKAAAQKIKSISVKHMKPDIRLILGFIDELQEALMQVAVYSTVYLYKS